MLPADGSCVAAPEGYPALSALEKVLRGLSVFTMLMTVPQVLTIWIGRDASGISVGFLSRRCLSVVYLWDSERRQDLDAAIVVGILVHS